MGLSNEAAYLYAFSKRLSKINRKIRFHSKKAEKHRKKHDRTSSENKREHHRKKHEYAAGNIGELMKEHNKILGGIKQHYAAFTHALRKEHKIK